MAKGKMKRAFTLIELVVAIAILAMVFSFAGVIFKVSIGAYRTGIANAEIMRKLRAITDQLNTDFKSVGKGMPIVVWQDRIVFLANGDFQSIRQYTDSSGNTKTVAGNLASIFYGMTDTVTVTGTGDEVLSRGQMILTSDDSLPDSNALDEYFKMSFYEFKAASQTLFDGDKRNWAGASLPALDPTSEEDLVRYMAKGVSDFRVHVAEWNDVVGRFDWLPGDGSFVDADHAVQIHKRPGARALKFTFTLHDSMGIIENGRRFTHIVYLGD
jgi:prepilin-type N-terminal cleavage/methylation domain-containing protein